MTALPAEATSVRLRLGSAAALAGLPGMGPRRLTALLVAWEPAEAWARATSGRRSELTADADVAAVLERAGAAGVESLLAAWCRSGQGIDPAEVFERHAAAGVRISLTGDSDYPAVLADDIEPPAVLFRSAGDIDLDRPRVSIVGTRRCTGLGAGVARELGRELTAAGVTVTSGLALGIDGAAHRGALEAIAAGAVAPPIGVVGCGIDVPYPSRHRDLWRQVGEAGLLLSETPLGIRPSAWRFPARNRVIAALAHLVVVVESHAAGGSMHTVEEAERRSVPVMAVPGSVRNPASRGTNALVADGCQPVCDAGDVLLALGLTKGSRRSNDRRVAPSPNGATLLAAFDWEPATLEHLAVRSGLPIPELSLALEELQAAGWIGAEGGWYERIEAAR